MLKQQSLLCHNLLCRPPLPHHHQAPPSTTKHHQAPRVHQLLPPTPTISYLLLMYHPMFVSVWVFVGPAVCVNLPCGGSAVSHWKSRGPDDAGSVEPTVVDGRIVPGPFWAPALATRPTFFDGSVVLPVAEPTSAAFSLWAATPQPIGCGMDLEGTDFFNFLNDGLFAVCRALGSGFFPMRGFLEGALNVESRGAALLSSFFKEGNFLFFFWATILSFPFFFWGTRFSRQRAVTALRCNDTLLATSLRGTAAFGVVVFLHRRVNRKRGVDDNCAAFLVAQLFSPSFGRRLGSIPSCGETKTGRKFLSDFIFKMHYIIQRPITPPQAK